MTRDEYCCTGSSERIVKSSKVEGKSRKLISADSGRMDLIRVGVYVLNVCHEVRKRMEMIRTQWMEAVLLYCDIGADFGLDSLTLIRREI